MASKARSTAEARRLQGTASEVTRWVRPHDCPWPGATSKPGLAVPPALASRTGTMLERLAPAVPDDRSKGLGCTGRSSTRPHAAGAGLSRTGTLVGLTGLLDGVRGEDSGRIVGVGRAVPSQG